MSILDIDSIIQNDKIDEIILKWMKEILMNSGYDWEQVLARKQIKLINGVIDFYGNLNLRFSKKGNFPNYIKFGKVTGSFSCSGCGLTSLRGTPDYVGGNFDCSCNYLTTLKNGPKEVKGAYYADFNNLKNILVSHNLPEKLQVLNIEHNINLKNISGLYNINIDSLYIRDCKNVYGAENIEHIPHIFPFGSTKLVEELKFFNIQTFE